MITIWDSGPGIPADALPRVFERRYRGDSSRSRGTGLGLALAKRTIEAHAGDIRLQNGENGGTTVTVTLPLA